MPKGVYQRSAGTDLSKRLAAIKTAQTAPLVGKVKESMRLVAAQPAPLVVMFSGGRDSSAVALLARDAGITPILLYCNTGLSSPDAALRVEEVARTLGFRLVVAYPDVDAETMWRARGHFPIGSKRGHTYLKQAIQGLRTSPVQCCYQLKERPARAALRKLQVGTISWGNRAADSNRRKLALADFGMVRQPTQRWPMVRIEPISFWLDRDVQHYLHAELPGFKWESRAETGCECCCTDLGRRDNNLSRLYLRDRGRFNAAMRTGLGEQILLANGTKMSVEAALEECPLVFLRIPRRGRSGAKKMNG